MSKEAVSGFTFGCDPEVFIVDAMGKPVSAAGIIPGTKEEPLWVGDVAVQVDGMAAEFNIKPTKSFSVFNRRIETALKLLEGYLPKGHSLSIVPTVTFDPAVFEAAPDEAKELGCMPDFNAWTGDVNPPPMDVENPYRRCAGGHLHVGWDDGSLDLGDDDHINNCREATQQFDWHIGAWALRLDPDTTRRRLYGRAGSYRPKNYGFEYRVLSNFWIVNQNRRLAVWSRMQNAIRDMRKAFLPDLYPDDSKTVVEVINSSVRSTALERKHRYPITSDSNRYPYADVAMAPEPEEFEQFMDEED